MARPPISMRQIKEILRLKNELKLSVRDIARSCAAPASTVGDYLKRAEAAGIGWPIPEEWTEDEILERLLGPAEAAPVAPAATVPDWAHIHEELRRPGVTLRLLWQEYRQTHPGGYGYSRFCELYDRWAGTLDPAWHDVIGDATVADAILDRLVHNAYRLDLSGESMRKLKNSIPRKTS